MYIANHRSSSIPLAKSDKESDSKETTSKNTTKSDIDDQKSVTKKN